MKIKKLNEQFAQTFSGDGFNSSNGVFKVKYKSYDDLSIARGREIHPYDYVKGEQYQAGDIVKAKLKGTKGNKILAEVVSSTRTENGKDMIFKVKSLKSNKIYTVPDYALEPHQDNGNAASKNTSASTISNKQKFLTALKYNNGNFIWGSLESKNTNMRTDLLLQEENSTIERPSIVDPSVKVIMVDENHPEYASHLDNFKKFGPVYSVPENKEIYIHKSDPAFLKFNDHHLIAIEALEIAKALTKDKTLDERFNDILAAQILRRKGHKDAYRILASNFMNKHGVSYGESADELIPEMEEYLLGK